MQVFVKSQTIVQGWDEPAVDVVLQITDRSKSPGKAKGEITLRVSPADARSKYALGTQLICHLKATSEGLMTPNEIRELEGLPVL